MKVVLKRTIGQKIEQARIAALQDNREVDYIVLTREEAQEFVEGVKTIATYGYNTVLSVDNLFIHSRKVPEYMGVSLYLEGYEPDSVEVF